jgi:Radical SAM superfamily/Domain of unknown function (DUF4070)
VKSLYLINPKEGSPGYHSMDVLAAWGIARAVNTADLTMPTIAAFAPKGWVVSICDERIQPVEFHTSALVIGITGKVSQRDRMIELAAEFRRRGKLVMIGGPYASLNPEDMAPHADILVAGEIEEIAGQLFDDIAQGRWQSRYQGTRPDLALSPVPRWDLYPRNVALAAQVQTSRGCPFECEFCDVIQYLGRKQRWKNPDQVLRELDVLYALGFRNVFFADDNFTVVRRRARELLDRLAAWNRSRPAGSVHFSTQLSIDLARDPDLMAQCVEAGLGMAFIGVETPNQDSLAETLKRQNLRINLADELSKVVQAGIMVMCGMIVGFDHDGPDIFDRQATFIESLPVPIISLGLLVAPGATPLHARLHKEGRIAFDDRFGGGGFLETNIRPKLMSEAQLKAGMRWLMNRIYAPAAFGRRVQNYVDASIVRRPATRTSLFGRLEGALAKRLAQYGLAERSLLELMEGLTWRRPDLRGHLSYMLLHYCQVRYLMETNQLWDPPLGRREVALAS